MSVNASIKRIVRAVKYKAQVTGGTAKQTAGRATGNDRLRREGKTEELKGRFNQFTQRLKAAVRPNR